MEQTVSNPAKTAKDPVCGMDVDITDPGVIKAELGGKTYYFCSTGCRDSFLKEQSKRPAGSPGQKL